MDTKRRFRYWWIISNKAMFLEIILKALQFSTFVCVINADDRKKELIEHERNDI